jgi:hypothetical protein
LINTIKELTIITEVIIVFLIVKKEKMPNEYREYRTLENYVKQTYFNGSQPSEMHILPLKDGYNLWFKPSFRGYDMSNPIFDKHNKRIL